MSQTSNITNSDFIFELVDSFQKFNERNAIFSKGVFTSYKQLTQTISNIRNILKKDECKNEKIFGIITTDDHFAYAAIIALWLEGKAYVPINPSFPYERNADILQQSGIKFTLGVSQPQLLPYCTFIEIEMLPVCSINLIPENVNAEDLAYILFTSGTTGKPKGVPITRGNLSSFIDAEKASGYLLNEEDRCLQMFELTFDFSVMAYLTPLVCGACIYLVPADSIKFAYIGELMEEQELTVTPMVPSVLRYLRKYFDELTFPKMRFSIFCGEALHCDITEEWQKCVPNASIYNYYGPTECTVFCSYYIYNPGNPIARNGILSIGKSMKGIIMKIFDQNDDEVEVGEIGELCLAGDQLTPGYWKDEAKNAESFFAKTIDGITNRFYRTGDNCLYDTSENIMYLGRKDSQVKIQGFRIELSEITHHIKTILGSQEIIVLDMENQMGNPELILVAEDNDSKIAEALAYAKTKIPDYMIPSKIFVMQTFPLNNNGKLDTRKIKETIYNTYYGNTKN